MIVDFHAHVFPDEVRRERDRFRQRDPWFATLYARPDQKLATAEDVVASMDRAGVDRTVLVGFPWRDPAICALHNDYLIRCVQRYPDRLIGFAIVQPAAGAAAGRELGRCLDAGLQGCGELGPDGQGFRLDNAHLLGPVAEPLIAAGRPLLTHCSEPLGHAYPGKGTVWPQQIYQAARQFPALLLVGAHWGGGLPFYELMPEVAATLRNVYYDTAASTYLYRFDIFRQVVTAIGADRILWATDYPLLGQARFLERTRAAGLAATDLAQILGG
ncbi:MAG TPA: amidohydrolase family protein, partial [Chloroflexia bacterium]|nr:amidohydrolase family protein [Chloroflexia bacterium]